MSETALSAPRRQAGQGILARLAEELCRADLSRAIGLTSLLLGAASGLVIGLWSFGGPLPVPDWIGGYGDLPRRLMRLAHVALFALGMINLMLARQQTGLDLPAPAGRVALAAMNLGNVLMPALLVAAVFRPEAKYLLALPALAVSTALAIAAYGGWAALVARPHVRGSEETTEEATMRHSKLERVVRGIVAAKAAREPAGIGRHDDFEEDLGLDSLHRLDLLAEVEDALGVRIPEQRLYDVRDLDGLLAAVAVRRCERAA